MLKRSLTELATGAAFSSEKLSACLRAYLREQVTPIDDKKLTSDCRKALAEDLDRQHPHRFRLNDLARAFDVWWPDDLFTSGKWPLFDDLFGQLMQRNGDFLQYRDDQVQAYARLAADVEPTLLAGWHIAGWALNGDVLPRDMARVVACQQPFFAPPPRPNRQYAEGHVHLGGIHFDALALLGNLDGELAAQFNSKFAPLRQLTKLLLEEPLRKGEGDSNKFRDQCRNVLTGREIGTPERMDWALLADEQGHAYTMGGAWLKARLASAMVAEDQGLAWRWLVIYLWYSFRDPATVEYARVVIFYLLGSLMQFRRGLIMDGQGLTRFTDMYYRNKLRDTIEFDVKMQDAVARMFAGRQDLAEIKTSPDSFSAGMIGKVAKAVARHGGVVAPEFGMPLPEAAVRPYVEHMERWHFCAHFLRREKYANERRVLWEDAERFARALEEESGWNLDEFLGGHLNPNYRFYPGRWLRGLDVAGDENLVRSEVFAPVLRWLRRGLLSRPPGEQGSAGFHLSIHAGEDYAHPLSGMRHVDETVRFCDMRAGDRIGHGLALGIEPQAWVARHGDMLLTVDEHVDNLVWAWHQACELSARLPLAAQIIPRLERRIASFLPHVSWSKTRLDVTPQCLHDAWALRRNCHYQILSNPTRIYDTKLRAAAPDYDRLVEHQHDTASTPERLYFLYQQRDPAAKPRNVLIRQPSGSGSDLPPPRAGNLLHDEETEQDLEFMCALQDHLLDHYDVMGLIIEANPTSNVYIARLENHSEHPIFRWYPPNESCLGAGERWNRFGLRRGPIKVLVNTDDPGIMPTTLRTEYALLGEAARDLGYSRTCVEAWQERLRQFGLDEFHRNHLPVFEESQ
ncbi:hypothetical protein IP92_03617 [Pseudoduganella flava]|uniref:Adenosine deaminase n=1 Tax=Pseudoduganella flava TaxID=871742 RepID=A0A562PL96_9BURK|nr:antiviral RADAR system adenosine deaminase RdrB [Pseudoduganella flava]QGZ41056.1 hypothetical protein GO485_19625 [Pseudoduganella flava]TWI45241.1 hypothetical protein IP92_03617 [Pseudoduganella flava]